MFDSSRRGLGGDFAADIALHRGDPRIVAERFHCALGEGCRVSLQRIRIDKVELAAALLGLRSLLLGVLTESLKDDDVVTGGRSHSRRRHAQGQCLEPRLATSTSRPWAWTT